MKVIIAGSRKITDYARVKYAIKMSGFEITTVISGGAVGVDSLGERYAAEEVLDLEIFKPDWNRYGKSAGMIRNVAMAESADALIAVWDGVSRGTSHMIETAIKKGIKTYVLQSFPKVV